MSEHTSPIQPEADPTDSSPNLDADADADAEPVPDAATESVEQSPAASRFAPVVQFGLRAAALASLVAPVAMVVSGLAGGILNDGGTVLITTCCPAIRS